jgi:hypothetical protein
LGQKTEIFENLQKVTETTQGGQLTIFRPWDAVLGGMGPNPQLPAVFEKIAILGSKMAPWFFRGKFSTFAIFSENRELPEPGGESLDARSVTNMPLNLL